VWSKGCSTCTQTVTAVLTARQARGSHNEVSSPGPRIDWCSECFDSPSLQLTQPTTHHTTPAHHDLRHKPLGEPPTWVARGCGDVETPFNHDAVPHWWCIGLLGAATMLTTRVHRRAHHSQIHSRRWCAMRPAGGPGSPRVRPAAAAEAAVLLVLLAAHSRWSSSSSSSSGARRSAQLPAASPHSLPLL